MQLKATAAAFDMLLEVLEKEKTAPREAAQNKTYQAQDNTERKLEQARVCAACGRPLGRMAYEAPSGDLLHPDDRCLAGYIGATLSVSDSILFEEAVAKSA